MLTEPATLRLIIAVGVLANVAIILYFLLKFYA